MTWKITPTYTYDSQAAAYITAVETADGQALEVPVKVAINEFVLGCKRDGIWNAIKASCILAGARTLNGALVPLAGAAPTNFNFVAGDYNRKTGLVGDGSTKYLNSNRNNNADPQNSRHLAVYVTQFAAGSNLQSGTSLTSGGTSIRGLTSLIANVSGPGEIAVANPANINNNFLGVSRSTSAEFVARGGQTNLVAAQTSTTPVSQSIHIHRRGTDPVYGTNRLAFYSIGEALDLALLDARVTTLIAQFAAAIP